MGDVICSPWLLRWWVRHSWGRLCLCWLFANSNPSPESREVGLQCPLELWVQSRDRGWWKPGCAGSGGWLGWMFASAAVTVGSRNTRMCISEELELLCPQKSWSMAAPLALGRCCVSTWWEQWFPLVPSCCTLPEWALLSSGHCRFSFQHL